MKIDRVTVSTLLGLALLGGCMGTNRRPADRPSDQVHAAAAASPSRERPALDEKGIADMGLDIYWDSYIRGETVLRLQLEGKSLYAITESNRVYQVDLHSGKVNWVFEVDAPVMFVDRERPICEFHYPVVAGEDMTRYDEVYFIAKDRLYALDAKGGAEIWRFDLPFGASCPPAASPTHVFVGSWDDWIYAIAKSSNTPVTYAWKWRTNGDIYARPAVAPPHVFVASKDGALYPIDIQKGELPPTDDPIRTLRTLTADPLIHKKLIYLGSEDMTLYVYGQDDRRLEYKLEAGAPIRRSPWAVGNEIYIPTDRVSGDRAEEPRHGLVSLLKEGRGDGNKTKHRVQWTELGAERFLARGRECAYVLKPEEKAGVVTRKIVKLDAKEGYHRDELKVANVDFFVTNTFDPNVKPPLPENVLGGIVFLGFRNGWIVALKEKHEF